VVGALVGADWSRTERTDEGVDTLCGTQVSLLGVRWGGSHGLTPAVIQVLYRGFPLTLQQRPRRRTSDRYRSR
jgi:hypothetical protein